MSSRTVTTTAYRVFYRFPLVAMIGVTVSSIAGAAEIPSLDEIKSQFQQQREKIDSLYVEVKREEKPCVDIDVLLTLPGFTNKVRLMNDEVHFAFKGEKRYHRTVRPGDTKRLRPVGEPPKLPPNPSRLDREMYKQQVKSHEAMKQSQAKAERRGLKITHSGDPVPDEIRAFNGRTYWTRTARKEGKVQIRISRPRDSMHWFQPTLYLRSVGLAILDPAEKEEAALESQRMALLPDLFERWSYSVSGDTEKVDGAECLVLTGKPQLTITVGEVTQTMDYDDRLWLDPGHGLAIRRRDIRMQGRFVRTVNSDFYEVLPGFWLPKNIESQTPAPPGAPEEFEGRPVMIMTLTLAKCVVNEVPDDLFDMVTKPGDDVIDFRDPKWRRP